MNSRTLSPSIRSALTLGLILGVAAFVGCHESVSGEGLETSSQELVLLSLQDSEGQGQAVSFGYTDGLGWHFQTLDHLVPTYFPGTEDVDVRQQGLWGDLDFGAGTGARFSGSTPKASAFSGSMARATTFQARTPKSLSFTGATSVSTGFTGALSAGNLGQCSLRGVCDFVFFLCDALGGEDECSPGQVQQCYAEIDSVFADIPPSSIPVVCALTDYFECAFSALRAGIVDEQTRDNICR
ncbi:MAG: hypothetical protein ACNA8W_25020, partial [Bradymonadaceae bacterium]